MKAAKRDVLVVPPEKFQIVDNADVIARLNGELPDELADEPACGIRPMKYKVVVRPVKAAEKTKGGIVLPDEVIEKDQHASVEGEIAAISPIAFTYDNWPAHEPKPRVGDRVLFARYSGITRRGKDGTDYRIMNDDDIVAVLVGGAA